MKELGFIELLVFVSDKSNCRQLRYVRPQDIIAINMFEEYQDFEDYQDRVCGVLVRNDSWWEVSINLSELKKLIEEIV